MANLYDTSANSTFNEDQYINKLYDQTKDSHKAALQQGYDNSAKQLATGQQNTQKQTDDYVKRAYVEGEKAGANVGGAMKSTPSGAGANAQAQLTLGNQQQANTTDLQNQQSDADQEYERRRKLLADKYSAQIRQAQADNDMARAQALYEAARAEEEQLRSFRQSAATLMQNKGDNSIVEAIAQGTPVTRDTTSGTWDGVLKNEESINKIYDAQLESERQAAEIAHMEEMSALDAQQQEARKETDRNLTGAYVDALKKNRNYQETQTAYGQGSGTAMQARLAREAGLMEKLTDLRRLQLGRDADAELDRAELVHTLGSRIAESRQTADQNRNKALYDAAEQEEQALVSEQQMIGALLAKKNNYSALGKLYGLTQDQIDRLQGTGKYKKSSSGGGGGTSKEDSSTSKSKPIYDGGGTVNNAELRKENLLEKKAASKYNRG